jgi:hypothetical protein
VITHFFFVIYDLLFFWDILLRQFTFIHVLLNISKFLLLWFFYTLFTLCPFNTKMGSIFIFGPRLYF